MNINKQSSGQDESEVMTFGALSINKPKRQVSVQGSELSLTAKEFDLLLYLASYPGQVFSREQLLNAVWG